MQQRKINKFCRVLFGDIFIVPFLGPALGYMTAMCSPGWGNLVAFDWNDLPVGREFDCKFLKNVKSPPHALPPSPQPPHPPRRHYIDRCISTIQSNKPEKNAKKGHVQLKRNSNETLVYHPPALSSI